MAVMEPFKVSWELSTPMVEPTHAMHLDSLLARVSVWRAEAKGGCTKAEEDAAAADLPLQRETGPDGDWFWRASQLFLEFDGPAENTTMFRRTDMYDIFLWKGRLFETDKSVFPPGTGPFRSFAIPVALRHVVRATAWGIGDIRQVRSMLAELDGLGQATRVGWGAIKSFEVIPSEDAHRFWTSRSLPMWAAHLAGPGHARAMLTTRAPYHQRAERRDGFCFVAG